MDLDYWRAKLAAWAIHEPKNISEEHAAFRRDALMAAAREAGPPVENGFDLVAEIHRTMQQAGLIPHTHGAVH